MRGCFGFSSRSGRNVDEKVSTDKDGVLEFAPHDPENPKNFTFRRKYYITTIAISLVMNATFASSAPTGTLEGISDSLHVSAEAAGLVTSLFLVGYCTGPLFWAPLSEFYGRRWIFHISFLNYIAFGFLCAFTPNFGGLLVGRFITGTAASAALTNAPGVLSDIWAPTARDNAMILFSAMTFVGPALGPVVGGFLQLRETWRWTFYVLLWMAGGSEVLLLTLPETLPSAVLRNKALRIRKLSGKQHIRTTAEADGRSLASIYKRALTRPWILLVDPVNFLVAIYYSVVYTLLYMLFTIYPIVFQQKRGWNAGVRELPLIGTVVGACLGSLSLFLYGRYHHKWYIKHHHKKTPEDRLPAAMVGGVMFAVSIFWFAWSSEYNDIHWIVPTIAGVFLAMSILLIFVVFINYIIESYLMYAASAVAGNTILRSACAASSPLFTQYMFDALGVGGAGSLIGGLGVLLMPIPFVFYKYGAVLRARSRYMSLEATVQNASVDENESIDEESGRR